MSDEHKTLLQSRLERLEPEWLEVIDESHLHAGHEGAKGGASHFRVQIWCAAFAGLGTVARHRMVYACVQDLMPFPIHALAIEARDPF